VVHLFGNVAPIAEIAALGVPVVEDAAQAVGSRVAAGPGVGALGTISTFSFYPSKNLGAFGDGGAVCTNDHALAERVRALRFHGSRDKATFEYVGYNSRLDEIQAAILRVQLPHVDAWCDRRRLVAEWYWAAGLGEHLALPVATLGSAPAWHLYVAGHPDAARLVARLGEAGIQARGYYRVPVHRQTAMAPYAEGVVLPVTDRLAEENLALPMHAALEREQVESVVASVGAALTRAAA